MNPTLKPVVTLRIEGGKMAVSHLKKPEEPKCVLSTTVMFSDDFKDWRDRVNALTESFVPVGNAEILSDLVLSDKNYPLDGLYDVSDKGMVFEVKEELHKCCCGKDRNCNCYSEKIAFVTLPDKKEGVSDDPFKKWEAIINRDKGEVTYSWTVLAEMFNDFKEYLEEGKGEKPELDLETDVEQRIKRLKSQILGDFKNGSDFVSFQMRDLVNKRTEFMQAKITSLQSEVEALKNGIRKGEDLYYNLSFNEELSPRKKAENRISELESEVERLKATALSTQEVFKNMIQDRDEEIERLRTQAQEPVKSAEGDSKSEQLNCRKCGSTRYFGNFEIGYKCMDCGNTWNHF